MEEKLQAAGFINRKLREHQVEGVQWLSKCFNDQNGCILADEMGLGKTTQSLAFFGLKKDPKLPSLVIAPLSILNNWIDEFEHFLPCVRVKKYYGDLDTRISIQTTFFDVLVTTYEILLKDSSFFVSKEWHIMVIDEGHRLKNSLGQSNKVLTGVSCFFRLLLSGTPVQNNMQELYSLLSFVDNEAFPLEDLDDFCKRYDDKKTSEELHELLRPYLLRRTKNQVLDNLPPSEECILTCEMSSLQKKVYRACLAKDSSVIDTSVNKSVLQNTIMQLRKCSNHPYMFVGIEPEPFCIGEHIVEASGKLKALDKILLYCKQNSHRVLIFSQFTLTLDIIQDYAQYRSFSYERLDGSVRDEERYNSISNFSKNEVFCFLLSTKAGGVGLNLTAADTIVFFDSDWNPQNDIQAAARAHRIGQKKPVKIIRLISKNTADEYMLKRMEAKLKLTKRVITEGDFSSLERSASDAKTLSDMIMFGLSDLFAENHSDDSNELDIDLVLGETNSLGEWVFTALKESDSKLGGDVDDFYDFEGENYREKRKSNRETFQNIIDTEKLSCNQNEVGQTNSKINRDDIDVLEQQRKVLLGKKRAARNEKRMKKWTELSYSSTALEIGDLPQSDSGLDMTYVVGDVTVPDKTGIIIHFTDSNGRWGTGGLFTALDKHSDAPRQRYELAKDMDDLRQGQCHLVQYVNGMFVALLICIKRGPATTRLDFSSLNGSLLALGKYAKSNSLPVHMPRIGFKADDWYSVERLLRKCLLSQGIATTVYYYSRHRKRQLSSPKQKISYKKQKSSQNRRTQPTSSSSSKSFVLPNSFSNAVVYLDPSFSSPEVEVLKRYIIAADGEVQTYLNDKVTCVVSYNQNFVNPGLVSANVISPYSLKGLLDLPDFD